MTDIAVAFVRAAAEAGRAAHALRWRYFWRGALTGALVALTIAAAAYLPTP